MAEPTIAVLTATFNCKHQLPGLIESLRQQTDKRFRWVVADGQSTDGTAELLRSVQDLDMTLICEPDCGIYDAFNKGLARIDSDYYIVAGADDMLYPDAIRLYRQAAADTQADIIAGGILMGRQERVPSRWRDPLGGMWRKITNHSVGTLIRRNLHDRLGLYSMRYPIAADTAFLLKAYNSGARFAATDHMVGQCRDDGISGSDYLRTIFESTLVRVEGGYRLETEMPVMLARLVRNWRRIRRWYAKK